MLQSGDHIVGVLDRPRGRVGNRRKPPGLAPLAAFALGLMLFTVTLLLNIFALHIVKKYREQYD